MLSYMNPTRSAMSREELTIEWQYPVSPTRTVLEGDRHITQIAEKDLTPERAFRILADGDTRPLLVLRECLTCEGTDDALLTRQADNEKTLLMSRWFRCVKLPPAVTDEDHPFRRLFEGKEPPHLFLAKADGSERIDLQGDQSRTELWKVMGTHLKAHYADSASKSLKVLAKVLDEYDAMELRLRELNRTIDDAIERYGPDHKKARKAMAEREELLAERKELQAKVEAASHLEPREAAEKA